LELGGRKLKFRGWWWWGGGEGGGDDGLSAHIWDCLEVCLAQTETFCRSLTLTTYTHKGRWQGNALSLVHRALHFQTTQCVWSDWGGEGGEAVGGGAAGGVWLEGFLQSCG
jgi:hypothetical protein